jgi:hypothetical protein
MHSVLVFQTALNAKSAMAHSQIHRHSCIPAGIPRDLVRKGISSHKKQTCNDLSKKLDSGMALYTNFPFNSILLRMQLSTPSL